MLMLAIFMQITDQSRWEELSHLAESQAGYITAAQAKEFALHRNTIAAQARPGGRLEHVARGLYRLRYYPSLPFDHVVAAWVLAGPEIAVISHESALDLYGLSDVIPAAVNLTLPRAYRYRKPPVGVRFHFPRTPLAKGEVRRRQGLRVTTPERTIVDAIEGTTQPEQIEMAVHQALAHPLTTRQRLEQAAIRRPFTTQSTLKQLLALT